MRKLREGVRVLEVAQFTYVPSAGAVLADWGAEVIKIVAPRDRRRAATAAVGGQPREVRRWSRRAAARPWVRRAH